MSKVSKVAILVTGDRHATEADWGKAVSLAIVGIFNLTDPDDPIILIHGAARGIDTIVDDRYRHSDNLTVEAFPADWTAHGRAAGPIRNKAMLDRLLALRNEGYAPLVIAFHDDIANSKGTKGMARLAYDAGLPVTVYTSGGQSTVYGGVR